MGKEGPQWQRVSRKLVVGSNDRFCFVISNIWKRVNGGLRNVDWCGGTRQPLHCCLEVSRTAPPSASPEAEVGLSVAGASGQYTRQASVYITPGSL